MRSKDSKNDTAMAASADAPVRILQWGMLGGRGGIEMFIMNLYRAIDRSQVQFDFLNAHDQPPYPLEEEIRDLGGRVYRVQYSQKEAPFTAQSRLVRFYKEHPEIAGVHVNANFSYAAPLAAAKRAGIRLRILHSHNSQDASQLHASYGGNPLRSAMAAMRRHEVQWAIDHCPTHYFACSDLAADYMFPGKPYTWIKNGINTGEFAFSEQVRGDVRKRMGLSASTTVIGFCGRLREQKNPLFAVDVFAAYHAMNPDSKFMVVGDGELMEPMRRRVTEQGLPEDAVMFMGGERDDVSRLYQAMDALLMPSRFEGLPLVLIEAQTAGLPCIASADVITQDARVTDLVHFAPLTSSPQAWADAMHRGIVEAEERKSRAGEVRAAGFDMTQTAAQLCAFYTEHAGRNQR